MKELTLEDLLILYLYGRYRITGSSPDVFSKHVDQMNRKTLLEAYIEKFGKESVDTIASPKLHRAIQDRIVKVSSSIQVELTFHDQGISSKIQVVIDLHKSKLCITDIHDKDNLLNSNRIELPHQFNFTGL